MPLYFAYGSNMDRARLEARIGDVLRSGVARLDDHELRFNKRSKDGTGKANVVQRIGSFVEGGVYEVSDEQLAVLDKFEKGYHRVTIAVSRNKAPEMMVTYIADAAEVDDSLTPSAEYLQFIRRGAEAFGLSRAYQETLAVIETT